MPELNRSIQLDYTEDSKIQGISTRRFVWSNNTFRSGSIFKKNQCYFRQPSSQNSGVLFNSHCNYDESIAFSNPHFYLADLDYLDAVKGLGPEKEKHESFIQLNKANGEVVLARKNIQINLDTEELSKDYVTKKGNFFKKTYLNRIIFPLFWVSETTRYVN